MASAPAPSVESERTTANQFVDFMNKSRSAFAAAASVKEELMKAGFSPLSETSSWAGKIAPGGRYFFTRNDSTIAAFVVGGKVSQKGGPPTFVVSAAHTDSPCLKVKPVSAISKHGALQLGVECYGGGLWHTHFDRDLGLSGRVLVREGDHVVSRIVSVHEPILRIPNLAIHLDRTVSEGFKFNNEEQLVPILASTVRAELEKSEWTTAEGAPLATEHSPVLLALLARTLKVSPHDIFSFELSLCDTQDAVLGGAFKEYIFSGRLDNLMMSWCSLQALLAVSIENVQELDTVSVAILFDNEEVGSASSHGADSSVLQDLMCRAAESLTGAALSADSMAIMYRSSFLLSCDMAHAVHPNYSGKHESNHKPLMHGGLVIKHNANQRYATSAESSYFVKELAKQLNVPLQSFVVRNDSPCGSTIGPILASRLGMRTLDVGIPQLSMHSIREQAATSDLVHAIRIIKALFSKYSTLRPLLRSDN